MNERSGSFLLAVLAVFAGFICDVRGALAQDAECYDAEVSARIVSQTPTVAPGCDDCIITSWPWIVDLNIRRVHSGDLRRGGLTVLTVQHTDFRRDLGVVRWKLRHNAQGGLNVVGFLGGGPNRLCSVNDPRPTAFITPADGQSLDDLRREGLKHYDRDS